MEETARLAAIEAIKQLKARYFRTLDARDLAGYAGVFTPEARIDVRGSVSDSDGESSIEGFDADAVIIGGEVMAAFVARITVGVTTVHHGHMPEIEILSADNARAIWAFEDRIWFPDGSPFRMTHGFGHYHETYALRDGQWRIDSMRITRIHLENHPW